MYQTLSKLEAFLATLIDEGAHGSVQRQLVANLDEKTFKELANLLQELRRILAELDERP
jgi:hypothetical protein